MTLDNIATALVIACAVPAVIFPVAYGLLARWTENQMGRHFMAFTVVVAVFLTLAASTRLFGPYPGQPYVAVVLYAVLAVLLWRQLWLLWQAQRRRT